MDHFIKGGADSIRPYDNIVRYVKFQSQTLVKEGEWKTVQIYAYMNVRRHYWELVFCSSSPEPVDGSTFQVFGMHSTPNEKK